MTVRGPPGPPGPPGRGWLDTSFAPGGSCGCNETLLRLYVQVRVVMVMIDDGYDGDDNYVQDLNPKLIPGPMGPPGSVGPVGPSGLPVCPCPSS